MLQPIIETALSNNWGVRMKCADFGMSGLLARCALQHGTEPFGSAIAYRLSPIALP